jgi:hypothetical protein
MPARGISRTTPSSSPISGSDYQRIAVCPSPAVIPGYAGYLAALDRLAVPFRIGLLQGGEWEAPDHLAGNPWFRGYVVFLVNE